MKCLRLILACGLASALAAAAQKAESDTPVRPLPSAAISSTHRFMATGALDSAGKVTFAAAAEDAAERLETALGIQLPFGRGQPVELVARVDPAVPSGSVIRAQGWVDRALAQKLIVINPEKADQEDVLEGLCWLLLNRCVIAGQDVETREARLGEVPDWLSVGAAQNLYPHLRARNRQVVIRAWKAGTAPAFAEVLGFTLLPPGRWGQKAFCAAAVDLIASSGSAGEVFRGLFDRLARGEPVDAAWMAGASVAGGATKDLEKEWDLWIARQTQVRRYGETAGSEPAAALRAALEIDPLLCGFTADDGLPAVMTPADLIDRRGEPWMPKLAGGLSLKVRGLGLGESEAFRRTADRYGDFFDALAQRGGWLGRLTGLGRPSRMDLLVLLKLAGRSLADYEQAPAPDAPGDAVPMDRFMPADELRAYIGGARP